MTKHKPYPSDVSDEECSFVVPYLTLIDKKAPQPRHELRGYLLAAHVTPANEQERAQVQEQAPRVQHASGQTVKLAFADQGYTGVELGKATRDQGIALQVIKLPEAKKGLVLLPRRWVVERSLGWLNRFRRLARDYERLLKLWPVCIPLPSPC